MPNLVPEDQETTKAEQAWISLQAAAAAERVALDPPGDRLDQIKAIFRSLVSVAHRQQLPWQVHLVADEMVNAMTVGGGMVWIFSGIFTDYPHGKGFVAPTDDEIAAVLAHEVAHVTLLHISKRTTSGWFTKRDEQDPYYQAAYTTEQESEADRLSVLYMALAGFDPGASARIWRRANAMSGSHPGLYLHDHPLNAERVTANANAATQVMQYYDAGHQNPDWELILQDNPLFPRVADEPYFSGKGAADATTATLEAMTEHERAKAEAARREQLAHTSQARLVQLVATIAGYDAAENPIIQMQLRNGSAFEVSRLDVVVLYGGGGRWLAQDPACGGPASIPAGHTVWLACPAQAVPGATQFSVQLRGVAFR